MPQHPATSSEQHAESSKQQQQLGSSSRRFPKRPGLQGGRQQRRRRPPVRTVTTFFSTLSSCCDIGVRAASTVILEQGGRGCREWKGSQGGSPPLQEEPLVWRAVGFLATRGMCEQALHTLQRPAAPCQA